METELKCKDEECIKAVTQELDKLHDKIEENSHDLNEIKNIVGKLADIQRITTQNIKILTNDVQNLLKTSLMHEAHQKEIADIREKLEALEENKIWLNRLIIGAFIMAVISMVIGGHP